VQLHKLNAEARDKFVKETKAVLPVIQWQRVMPKTLPAKFDWVSRGKVTRVKDQGDCGSCWDFAAIAAFESSYAIHNGRIQEASEQQVLDCGKAGSCCGGWHTNVFDYLVRHGTSRELEYHYYRPGQGCCNDGAATPLRAVAWGHVNPNVEVPSVRELKQALGAAGPRPAGGGGQRDGAVPGLHGRPTAG
jgi:cathepsin L